MSRNCLTISLVLLLAAMPASACSGASARFQQSESNQPAMVSTPVPDSLFFLMGGHTNAQIMEIQSRSRQADHSLFKPIPAGWTPDTIRSLFHWVLSLPLRTPELIKHVTKEGRLFGAMGSILLIVFIVALLYSAIWRKRILRQLEKELQPLLAKAPAETYPRLLAFIRIVISPLLPLLFLGLFLLIQGFLHYEAPWFTLVKGLLALWAGAALAMSFLREFLTDGLLPHCPLYGRMLLRVLGFILIYIAAGVAVIWGVETIQPPHDVPAFLRFAVSLTAVCFLSLLLFKKEAILSLLPRFPYRSYSAFIRFLDRAYLPLALLTFITGLLWCLGYRRLSDAVLTKTWGVAGAYVAIMVSYHFLSNHLRRWSERKVSPDDESAKFFLGFAKAFLKYGTFAIAVFIVLDLLGLLAPLDYVLSIPVFTIGNAPFSFMLLIKAGLIFFAFVYVSKLLQVYLDYKIYPSIGVDTGLAYAINTFLKYFFLAVGTLAALRIIGLDLRVLMVFAGGLGIGAGFGLQNIAGNIVSGFILVFGRKLRKGDWIKVGDKLGMVTHIYLRATKLWTRDNIEFIVPNTDLVSKQIVNYTLTSPVVRIHIPVGVSYDAAPPEVLRILLECAEKHQIVTQFRKPDARIVEFGDNSVNFELLVWIDISKVAERDIRSRLYFTIFEALSTAGIKIPYPQRDVHISTPVLQSALNPGDKQDSDSSKPAR